MDIPQYVIDEDVKIIKFILKHSKSLPYIYYSNDGVNISLLTMCGQIATRTTTERVDIFDLFIRNANAKKYAHL